MLTPILGGSELLLNHPETLDNKEEVTRYLQWMNTAAQDVANVVRRLREFYRPRGAGEIFPAIDLNEPVEQAVLLTQPKWKDLALAHGVTIQVETDLQPVPAIASSKAELREALGNMVFNAVDAMPEGGTITLHTHADGSQVVLEVNDTGMGLAMVYGSIGRHNGTIGIQSTVGVGITISIRLPVHIQALSDKDNVRNSPHIGSIYFIEGRPLKKISLERLRI